MPTVHGSPTSIDLDYRLERLEKELATANQRFRYLLGAVLLSMAVAATTAFSGSTLHKNTIRANEFILEDTDGRTRAVLGSSEGTGSFLELRDELGVAQALLSVGEDGDAELVFFNESGIAVELHTLEGGGRLSLADQVGEERVILAVAEALIGLALIDDAGEPRALFGLDQNGPTLAMVDAGEIPRVQLSVWDVGPLLALSDRDGRLRLALSVSSEEGASLGLVDPGGVVRAQIGAGVTITDGGTTLRHPESSIRLFDAQSRVFWETPP
jgi:hypothetical protein